MVRKHLDEIRSRELDARQRVSRGKTDAEGVIEEAREEGERLLEQVRIDGNETRKRLTAEAGASAEKEIGLLRDRHRKSIADLETTSEKNREKALKIMIDEFCTGI